MTATRVRTHAGGQIKTSTASWSTGLSANVAAGNTLVMAVSFDNRASGLGGGPTVTGISVPTTQTVSGSPETASWQLIARLDAPAGTGGTTVVTEFWGITTTQTWLSTFVPVVTINVAVGGHAAAIEEWAGLTLTARAAAATNLSTAGTPSATYASAVAGDVLFGVFGFETALAVTGDSDTTNGTWSSVNSVATSGGGDTANVTAGLQSKVVTGSGSQTYNPTGANDAGVILVALTPAVPSGTGTGSYSYTGSASGFAPSASGIPSGVGAGSYAYAGSAVGTTVKRGTGVGTYFYKGVADPLRPFWKALSLRETARVNIGMIGASLVEGYPCTADKAIAQYLAAKMRTRFPTSGNPDGYGNIGLPSSAMNGIHPWVITAGTGGSVGTADPSTGWGPRHVSWYTNGSLALPPILELVLAQVGGPCSSFDINLLRSVGYSTTAGKYRIDGGAWVNFSLAANPTQTAKLHVASPANSTIEVTIETGNASTYVIVNSITLYGGDESKGIQAHNFGHSGFRADQWTSSIQPNWDWRFDQFAEDLDLLIMQDFGVNDAQFYSSAVYRTNLISFMDYLRQVHATVPIAMVSVQDFGAYVSYVEPWDNYVAVNKEIAGRYGLYWIDYRGVIPSPPGSIYFTDNVHGATDGSMYSLMADTLFAQITPPVASGSGTGAWTYVGAATGVAPGLSTPTGTGSGTWTYSGSAAGTTVRRGTGGGTYAYAGTAVGKTVHRGSGSGTYAYAGAATGKTTHRGTGTGAWSVSGAAVGRTVHRGSGSGSYAFTGAPAVGRTQHRGTGLGAWAYSGSAGGATIRRGVGAGAYSYTGTAVGLAPAVGGASGVGSGSYAYAGTAVGRTVHRGTGSGGWAYAGSAVGQSSRRGTGVGSYSYTGTAVGKTPHRGSGAGSFEWTGTAVGRTPHRGSSTGSYEFTGAAVGVAPVVSMHGGSGEGVWDYIGTALGTTFREGSGSGSFEWVGTAVGAAPSPIPQPPPEQRSVVPPEYRVTVIPAEVRRTVRVPNEEGSGGVSKYEIDPNARKSYEIDWRDWLAREGDTIASYSLTPKNCVLDGQANEDGMIRYWVKDARHPAKVVCHIITAGGLEDEQTDYFTVRNR